MENEKRNAEGYLDLTAYKAIKHIEKEALKTKNRRYRPLVYVCSPYAGNIAENSKKARVYSRYVSDIGCIPMAPHLLFPQFLDDSIKEERKLGMFYGNVIMGICRKVWVFGNTITRGMQSEIDRAKCKGYELRYFDENCKEIKNPKGGENA